MRIPSILIRSALALAAALALAGPAPAGAQRLATTIGDPVEYRVDLPPEWDTEEEDGTLMAVSKDQDFAILIVAMDILADQEDPLPMSEADQRRFYTTMLMASDSLLLNLIGPLMRHQSDMPLTDVEQELGTLGGERAAVLFARTEVDGEEGWFRFHVTVKDGVLYMLGFMGPGEFDPAREPLMNRVHESFVLADVPPPLPRRKG